MKRDTVGKISNDLIVKQIDDQHSAHEQMQEQTKGYMPNLMERLEIGKNRWPGNFFIDVQTVGNRLLTNVLRNKFMDKKDCPTPAWDQSVYHYIRKDDALDHIWTVPDKYTCIRLYNNRLDVHPEEYELLKCVIEFYDGTLFRLMKELNNEEPDSPLLKKDKNVTKIIS